MADVTVTAANVIPQSDAVLVQRTALSAITAGQPVYVTVQTEGEVDIGGTVTVGGVYVLSGTAGAIAPVADLATGDYTTVIGIGKTATNLKLGIFSPAVIIP